jgi:glycosyltransferase involved in cell wall biosynthesis
VRLSIIIPTIGRETLERAVASAAACADEVIVVADGHPEVNADLHVDLGAPGLVRNAGAAIATGDWVGFLDDDDVLVPNAYRANWLPHPAADMIVHPMFHPELGPIPRPGSNPIRHGNVGISFTVRRRLFLEQPMLPGPPHCASIEDYEYVRRFVDLGRIVVMAQTIAYIVRPEMHRWPS